MGFWNVVFSVLNEQLMFLEGGAPAKLDGPWLDPRCGLGFSASLPLHHLWFLVSLTMWTYIVLENLIDVVFLPTKVELVVYKL